ncbi:hypothetical protein K504DRAFT_463505, partial [Pleomassaria siparia CBS 279.74]
MDHWGDPDPWADDASAEAALSKREEVATTKLSIPPGPALLHNFLDDAQWGNIDDDGFGAWATSPAPLGNIELDPTFPDARMADPSPTLSVPKLLDAAQSNEYGEDSKFVLQDEGWASLAHGEEEEGFKEVDHGISETSDSATTIQPDDAPARISEDLSHAPRLNDELSDAPRLDDELSTRTSTSPSDISHTEAPPTESPRTSFEDERIAGTATEASASIHEPEGKSEEEEEAVEVASTVSRLEALESEGAADDHLEDIEQDSEDKSKSEHGQDEEDIALGSPQVPKEVDPVEEAIAVHNIKTEGLLAPSSPRVAYKLDQSLMDQLFPLPKPAKELSKAPDEPVSTTSTRKSWYRLSRNQTMREYNTGLDHDDYVRVTWANSHIREEVKKTVQRWTIEDRMSGRGHSARASFYWDTSPAQVPVTHIRKKSVVTESSSTQPAKQQIPPLSANVPAAFNWSSSPLATNDPWRQDGPDVGSISSPTIAEHSAIPEFQAQESRPASIDLTPPIPVQLALSQSAPTLESPKLPPPLGPSYDSWSKTDPLGNLGQLDTSSHTNTADATEDDDEWGEMVESPTVSTTPAANLSQNSSHNHILSTPNLVESSPLQPRASRHASPIVRLKSTVSPTSSAFRFQGFVPVGTDVEKIGQGILKPTSKVADPVPVKSVADRLPTTRKEEPLDVDIPEVKAVKEVPNDVSAFEPSPRPELSTSDSFSAFESSIPAPAPMEPDQFLAFDPPASASPPMLEPVTAKTTNIPITTPASQTPTDAWYSADSATSVLTAAPSQTPTDPWSSDDVKNPTPLAPAPALSQTPTDPWFSADVVKTPTASTDAWSNVDFSFFETAAPVPPPAPPPPGPQNSNHTLSPSDPWSVFETPIPPVAPAATTTTTHEQRRKKEEDDVIAGIVQNLPDLSYML